MREAQLKHLEALALAATPGPWIYNNHNTDVTIDVASSSDDWSIRNEQGVIVCSEPQCGLANLPAVCNGAYIAAAGPATMLDLIAQVKRQYNEIQRQAAVITALRNLEIKAE